MRLPIRLMYGIAWRFGLASPQAALLANVLPCYSLPGMNRQRVDAVMIESWRRGGVGGGTVNLIDRGRNESRQMEPDVPMAMPF